MFLILLILWGKETICALYFLTRVTEWVLFCNTPKLCIKNLDYDLLNQASVFELNGKILSSSYYAASTVVKYMLLSRESKAILRSGIQSSLLVKCISCGG